MTFLLAALTAAERVEAVQNAFANRASDNFSGFLFWTFVSLTGVLAALAVGRRIESYLKKRRAARETPPEVPTGSMRLPPFGTPRPTVVIHLAPGKAETVSSSGARF